MSMEVHQSHVLMGGAESGRTVISTPEIPSAVPNHRENLVFTDGQKKNRPIPWLQNLRKQRLVLF